MNRLVVLLCLCATAGIAMGQESSDGARGLSDEYIRDVLSTTVNQTRLGLLVRDREAQERFLDELAFDLNLNVATQTLMTDPDVQSALREARRRVLIESLQRQIQKKTAPESEMESLAVDIYDAYNEAFKLPRKIKIAHISIHEDPCNPAGTEERMKTLFMQLENDASFIELAKEHSEAPNAQSGGIVNQWMVGAPDLTDQPPFVKEAFALTELGTYTQPFKSGTGWHIILLVDETPASVMPFEQVKSGIVADIRKDYQAKESVKLMESLQRGRDQAFDLERLREIVEGVSAARAGSGPTQDATP